TINGNITGVGGISVNAGPWNLGTNFTSGQSSTLVLNGTNTYGGSTTMFYGNLTIGNANAIPSNTALIFQTGAQNGVTTYNSTVKINADVTIGSLAGGVGGGGTVTAGTLNMNGHVLTIGNDNTSTSFGGNLNGGSLTKIGTGVFTLLNKDQ